MMQRLAGRYSIRSQPISQSDRQITPEHWKTVEGHKLPIRGPFTQVICDKGTAVLYVSEPGEVPLYYSCTPGYIHWHEQKLALPGRANRIHEGQAIIWTPQGTKTIQADELPRPAIRQAEPLETAIDQYLNYLKQAVVKRLYSLSEPVAVSQSGGIDSLMVTWALLQVGAKVVPMTVCTGADDSDISVALAALPGMGAPAPLPMIVPSEQQALKELIQEALLCFEDADVGNIKMALGNILMARKCRELGIKLIFNGHGQDDLQGVGGLMMTHYKKFTGTPSERWRDSRRKEIHASGMAKMFASTFRRYGIQVRMPFFDADLQEWALAQPTSVIPVHHAKPFARAAACSILPSGPWLDPKYNSTGYITGAGFYEDRLRDILEIQLHQGRSWLGEIRSQGWQGIAKLHAQQACSESTV